MEARRCASQPPLQRAMTAESGLVDYCPTAMHTGERRRTGNGVTREGRGGEEGGRGRRQDESKGRQASRADSVCPLWPLRTHGMVDSGTTDASRSDGKRQSKAKQVKSSQGALQPRRGRNHAVRRRPPPAPCKVEAPDAVSATKGTSSMTVFSRETHSLTSPHLAQASAPPIFAAARAKVCP